jgi:hypothetical protein
VTNLGSHQLQQLSWGQTLACNRPVLLVMLCAGSKAAPAAAAAAAAVPAAVPAAQNGKAGPAHGKAAPPAAAAGGPKAAAAAGSDEESGSEIEDEESGALGTCGYLLRTALSCRGCMRLPLSRLS